MAYDAYIESMCEVTEKSLTLLLERNQVRENWHDHLPGEPLCEIDEWRTKDRQKVIKISSMDLDHLVHCVRFATTKQHHGSKLPVLLEELRKRQGGTGRILDL